MPCFHYDVIFVWKPCAWHVDEGQSGSVVKSTGSGPLFSPSKEAGTERHDADVSLDFTPWTMTYKHGSGCKARCACVLEMFPFCEAMMASLCVRLLVDDMLSKSSFQSRGNRSEILEVLQSCDLLPVTSWAAVAADARLSRSLLRSASARLEKQPCWKAGRAVAS